MAEDDEPLRRQLIAARAKIRRQLEIMASPGSAIYKVGGPPDFDPQIAELQNELREIEALLGCADD